MGFCYLRTRQVHTFLQSLEQLHRPRDSVPCMPKAFTPKSVESDWYKWWEEQGYFKNGSRTGSNTNPPFSMILPPPNITGTLHLGHALTVTIQDVLARWYRMQGQNVVWVPGTDHAGIATQVVVEKTITQKKGTSRYDIGREAFLNVVWKWKGEKEGRINEQLKKLGASVDWSREFFTMDKKQSKAVTEAVIKLWEAGLIYKGESLVNWSCQLRSAISDIEVESISVSGPSPITVPGYSSPITFGQLTEFAYKLENRNSEVVVATTRPETMLGDVAVAVHPGDSRYRDVHGASLIHPISGRSIPVILDESVDPNFGTGAVKITPAHDQRDFAIAKKHNLPLITVITEDGTIADSCQKFSGMKRFDARKSITEALGSLGLLRGIKNHQMQLPVCSRSGDIVELLVKPQWFLRCEKLAETAITAVKSGVLVIEPKQFEKRWFDWLENIRDWCISRQLWWGHQLPLYECLGGDRSLFVGARSSEEAEHKGRSLLKAQVTVRRETDVLDTWFSSALLPFTCFGWPKQEEEFKQFYPLDVMVTGHDILFFWVARMVMLGTFLTGQLPFKKILLHGIICDSQGRKMSKSLGNVIDPEDVINGVSLETLKKQVDTNCANGILSTREAEKAKHGLQELFPQGIPQCGADALRFTLLSHKIKSHYINFNVSECHSNQLFCNKIWQAFRFARNWGETLKLSVEGYSKEPECTSLVDSWILSELSICIKTVEKGMRNGDFHLATAALRDFLYNDFCDVYLEHSKSVLRQSDEASVKVAYILLFCLDSALRAIAPFMPYLSEELYTYLPGRSTDSIMTAPYPMNYKWEDLKLKENVEFALEAVGAIRNLKTTHSLKPKEKAEVWVVTNKPELESLLPLIKSLTYGTEVTVTKVLPEKTNTDSVAISHKTNVHLRLPLTEPIKLDKSTLKHKVSKLELEIEKLNKMMSNEGYKKASVNVQEKHSEKLARLHQELKKLQGSQETF